MSSIQKLVRKKTDPITGKATAKTAYRVFIRKNGLKPITKTFGTKKLAQAYAARIEGDQEGSPKVTARTDAESIFPCNASVRSTFTISCAAFVRSSPNWYLYSSGS